MPRKMITFKQNFKELLPIYFFLQKHGTGNILSRFAMRLFSLPTSILCRYLPSVNIIGAFDKEDLIGLLIFNRVYGKINYLFIKSEYRKDGIGKQMIINSHCCAVRTCRQSLTFWKRRGFDKQIGRNLFIKGGQ